jgi:serine/threonine protein kinase
MEKYSCFCCPSKDYSEKNLTDLCPTCGNPYGFPLDYFPIKISGIKIIKPIDRGFYGATYVGEIIPFGTISVKKVIKIIPVALYKLHEKNFNAECDIHLQLSQNSTHFIKIDTNIFKENLEVEFKNGLKIECHVIGLEYIDGVTLKEFLKSDDIIPSKTIAQIAIDLLKILQDLRNNQIYHNDLHTGNIMIETLSPTNRRLNAIDENIKVVAIDLGSLNQKTKSNDDTNRIGDLHQIANCLNLLSRRITDTPDYYDQKDWRLAFLLEEKADFLKPSVTSQRQITFQNIISQIEDTVYSQTNPWQQELKLKSFDDAVNAQSLRPWYIPNLIVDKNDNWLNRISVRGPQVITGMRGCGKTMLLRALEFHARIRYQNEAEQKNRDLILQRINEESYLGLYVSCVKLLEFDSHIKKDENLEIFEPYSKLFIGYTIQAIYAIRHLKDDLGADLVRKDFYKPIATVLRSLISESDEIDGISSDYDLEIKLKKFLNSLSDGQATYRIKVHPKSAFPQLAEAIRKSSTLLSNFYIYFLLDDLSTRYLGDKNILKLISELLFQDETCAVKFTTEAQTLEMVIKAPGNRSQAKIGRDYTVFDLGEEVNKIVHENPNEGKQFIEEILYKRSKFHPSHPKNVRPSAIVGDTTLKSIAESIVKKEKASEKKGIYHGMSALTAVCVGDLGDVITLYEHIIRKIKAGKNLPVDREMQNQCFLELCNSRLYDLNRRDTRYLDFVESFADASHHMLLQSSVTSSKSKQHGLRQYTSIFINITYGDKKKQYEQVRELIDNGIFNFQGGPAASRTNRQGLKPQQQFKLVFRKLYGVSKHIGLSSADRFELSGKALADWLENPKNGKEILIGNLNSITEEKISELLDEKYPDTDEELIDVKKQSEQMNLFSVTSDPNPEKSNDMKENLDFDFILNKLPTISSIKKIQLQKIAIDVVVIGLGFEDATLKSAVELAQLKPKKVVFIQFGKVGKSKEIIDEFKKNGIKNTVKVKFEKFRDGKVALSGNVLCDVTGLPKAVIFDVLKKSLTNNRTIYLSITEPETIYPLDNDIKKVLAKTNEKDTSELLNEISKLLKGESGHYKIVNLLPYYTNISDPRVLFSFASAKHERLYNLLDNREYEKINIVIPNGRSPREELSRMAANFALRKYNNAIIHEIKESNIREILDQLAKDYYTYFIVNNFPFEIALTGSKCQTVAAAIFCAIFKVSQCWYIQPEEWDVDRFSTGAKQTSFYMVQHAD